MYVRGQWTTYMMTTLRWIPSPDLLNSNLGALHAIIESEVDAVTGSPEDLKPGVQEPECPETFPEEDEWRSPTREQGSSEYHSDEEREMVDWPRIPGSPSDQEVYPLTIENEDRQPDIPLHAVSWKDESHPMWVRIRTVMDSGAADSVAPPTLAPQVDITESAGSRRGQCYVSASGTRLANMGQKVLNVTTNEGKDTTVLYQIAEVSRPLTSVSATCDKGNWVVYTPKGGFIYNMQTGERTSFERQGGIYQLDLWVRDEENRGGQPSSDFPRQGY